MSEAEGRGANQAELSVLGPWLDRPRQTRVLESLGFAVTYFVGSTLYFTLWTMALIWMMELTSGPLCELIVLLTEFAAAAIPFEMVLWYFAATRRRRRLSVVRIIGIGLAAVVIPCLLVILFSILNPIGNAFIGAAAIIGIVGYMPAALPVGLLMTWGFARFRERAAQAALAEAVRKG